MLQLALDEHSGASSEKNDEAVGNCFELFALFSSMSWFGKLEHLCGPIMYDQVMHI